MHEHRMHGGRCLSMRDGTRPWTRGGMSPCVCGARTVARCGARMVARCGARMVARRDAQKVVRHGARTVARVVHEIRVICLLYVCTRKLILNSLICLFVFILMLR